MAVEVKLRPENDDTRIQHGLLQSMAYGFILQYCSRKDGCGLEQQIQSCMSEWCDLKTPDSPIEKTAYALAAPREYFSESLRESGVKEWIEEAINAVNVPFDGFWVLDYRGIEAVKLDGDSSVIPTVDDCSITRIASVQELARFCNQDDSHNGFYPLSSTEH